MANATPTQKQNKRAAVRSSERAAVAVPVVFCYHGAEVRIVLRLYSVKKTEKIIRAYSPWIEELSARYGIPAACIKAMLRKEVADIDILDPIADTLVWLQPRSQLVPMIIRDRDFPATVVRGNRVYIVLTS